MWAMPDHGSSDFPTRLFAENVQRTEAGESLDFDAFCNEHAAHADALHRLKQDWERIQAVPNITLDKLESHQQNKGRRFSPTAPVSIGSAFTDP